MNEGLSRSESLPDAITGQQKITETSPAGSASVASAGDLPLVEALRRGDESAFGLLIDNYHAAMLRLALVYVPNYAVAEEVVQEAWMGVLQGIDRFEARSSLKTWIFRILSNCAKTRGQREGRGIPFSALPEFDAESAESAVDPDRFLPPDDPQSPGRWATFPRSWDEVPEDRLLSQETLAYINEAIDTLPARQREVITLRDIEGWTSGEVCHFLGLTETNQRVLLHRARSRVRRALEQYFEE